MDCLIAAVAIRGDVAVLHMDADFDAPLVQRRPEAWYFEDQRPGCSGETANDN